MSICSTPIPAAGDAGFPATSAAGAAPPTALPPFHGTVPFFPFGSPDKPGPLAPPRHVRGRTRSVVFCWELGGELGHMMEILPLAADLVREGCSVFVLLRELGAAAVQFFEPAGIAFLAAPIWRPRRVPYPRPVTFTQMLLNLGYHRYNGLFGVASAWRNTLELLNPDLVVCNHSPTALLACRGLPCARALIGPGLCCPPEVEPGSAWGVLRPRGAEAAGTESLLADEALLLGRVNRVLAGWRQPPIKRVSQIYSDVHENFLTTFPELDPFQARRGAGYWGPVVVGGDAGCESPRWPEAPGRRIFAYLKRCAALEETLKALAGCRQPTVAYVDGVEATLRDRFESPTLHFVPHAVDLAWVARECDLAVVNGGHGATAEMLLAGRPMLQVPLALEQRLTANAARRIGAAEVPLIRKPGALRRALEALIETDGSSHADAARQFASRYAAFDARRQRRNMLARARELLSLR